MNRILYLVRIWDEIPITAFKSSCLLVIHTRKHQLHDGPPPSWAYKDVPTIMNVMKMIGRPWQIQFNLICSHFIWISMVEILCVIKMLIELVHFVSNMVGWIGWRIILPRPSTSIFHFDLDMDRGAGSRVHRVPKECRTRPRDEAIPRRQVLWSVGFGRRSGREGKTSTGWDQACSFGYGGFPDFWYSSCCDRKRTHRFYIYL